jgi:quinoprotein glucose dehydrogenase
LSAINVGEGRIVWKTPLGDFPKALALGLPGLGSENYGGPVVTAGSLVFIAATPDSKIRAFDKNTGEMLWQSQLPAPGFATPAVYEAGERPFLVIAAGGGKLGQPSGSAWVAFSLDPSSVQ